MGEFCSLRCVTGTMMLVSIRVSFERVVTIVFALTSSQQMVHTEGIIVSIEGQSAMKPHGDTLDVIGE